MNTGWRYVLTPRAMRAMERLPVEVQRRVYAAMDRLVSDIHSCDVRKLAGRDREFRLRVGDFRVIFGVEAEDRLYIVSDVTNRKDAYR